MDGEACIGLFNITTGSMTYQWSQGYILPSEPKSHPFPLVPLAVNWHSFKGSRATLGYTGFDDPEEGDDRVWAFYGSHKGARLTRADVLSATLPRRVP